MLRHLKNLGFTQDELVQVYKVIVRPVADYCAAVYHPLMTDQQEEELDRV